MHFLQSILAAILVAVASVAAGEPPTYKDCLNRAGAFDIVNQFIFLLENSNSTKFAPAAIKLMVPDFMDVSSSVNFMAGFPLGGPTFTSRKQFIKIAGSQPPFGSVQTLELFHDCYKIAWRWKATHFPPPNLEVVGINIFHIKDPSSGKVNSIHSEFDSGAFLANLGNPQCNSSSTSP